MFNDLNKKVWAAVAAANRAELPFLAKELYSVGPVVSKGTFRALASRVQTVKALLRLRPAPKASWTKCSSQFQDLYKEIEVVQAAVEEMS